ncbi:hypothetical protein [Novosphingobium sp.]|uniref:hypothetical protein n=1 Tax=Novosphingobium sp. TaxID=1874826 RepID=UPI0025D407E3|nr:hypothetical protein [Novosphingobium sp.]
MRTVILIPALVALAACQKADNQPGPGGVTVGEAKALDEAAEMIEDQRLTRDDLPQPSAPPAAPLPAKPAS